MTTPAHGVASRPSAEETRKRVERLHAMKPGESFFVESVTQVQMQSLRALANREKVKISIHEMIRDPVYGKAGCRVYKKAEDGTIPALPQKDDDL